MFGFSRDFWKAATERALKTGAQVFILLTVGDLTSTVTGYNLFTPDIVGVLALSVSGVLLSYVTSLASSGFGSFNGPSLANETIDTEPILIEVEVPVAPEPKPKKTAAK